ncbi:MAG: hypothetical protein R3E54_09385 [Halioglobus sp.]
MHLLRNSLALGLAGALCLPLPAAALSCVGWLPMLSPNRLATHIVEATVVGFVDADGLRDPWDHMQLHVSATLQGEPLSDTVLIDGNRFDPLNGTFPLGSSWILGFSGPNEEGRYTLPECTENLQIIDEQVSGYVRNHSCPDPAKSSSYPGLCNRTLETLGLNEFRELQAEYYAGIRQAVALCASNRIGECPDQGAKFFIQGNRLQLPGVEVYQRPAGSEFYRREWQAKVDVTLQLLGAPGGSTLLFELLQASAVQPPSISAD